MRKPTSSDVARLAGVSQSAVSRAFTPGASIAPATRSRILKAAEVLGYRPNALARSLISGRSRLVALVLAGLESQFFPPVLSRLSAAFAAHGYHLLVHFAASRDEPLDGILDTMIDYQVDGILVGSMPVSRRDIGRCTKAGTPVVLFDQRQDDPGLVSVDFDHAAGGRTVADHLVACGHRRIAHLAGPQDGTAGRDRTNGFLDGLAAHGLRPRAIAETNGTVEAASEAARAMFRGTGRPDAVFCGTDEIAVAVVDLLRRELGLAVPDDVAVVGYDDVPISRWPAYALTTVRQDAGTLARATAESLMARIEGEEVPARVQLAVELVVRSTTRALP